MADSPNVKRNRMLLGISLLALVLVLGFAWLGVALSPAGTSAGDRPQPTTSESPTLVPTPVASVIPASCDKIYTANWASTLSPNVLNPSWARSAGLIGSNNDIAKQLLRENAQLSCVWGASSAQGTDYLVTTLATVSADQAATAQAALKAAGYDCVSQSGGVRCVLQSTNSVGTWGETAFFKDNVWISTFWQNLGPDGYTSDIIDTLWP